MPTFAYTARNSTGEDVTGVISAESKRDVLSLLSERSLFPMQVDDAQKSPPRWQLKKRIKADLLATNLTQLADLLQNGVSLLAALDVLVEQATHPALANVFGDVRNQISEGNSLNEAFAAHPEVFNELTVSIVRAGYEGAFLEDALKQTADFLELQEELRGRVVGAMAYPVFLAVVGSIVTLVLIVFFVPKFADLFDQLREQGTLPGATVVLLWLSDFLGRFGLLIGAALAGCMYAARQSLSTPKGRLFSDKWKLKIPLAGSILLNNAVSRFCRVLGTLLRNGVPLLKALEISSESAGNVVLATAIRNSAENVSAGETLAAPLANCGLFPKPVMAMISVAEESNNLENVLINASNSIDRKTARQLDLMIRLIEPLLLMVMGSVILFVIVALLLPVFEMSTTMS